MASALIESRDFGGFLGKNYQSALDRSIQEFLDSPRDPNSEKFQSLSSNFQELLQCKLNPPLETVWFCSALDFRSSGSEKTDRPAKLLASIKDLFQLIVTRSLSSNSWRSIVLIAPVIYELFRFMSDLNSLELKSKKQKKLVEDVKDFVGTILGYVNICSEGLAGKFDAAESLVRPVVDLVDAWIGSVGEGDAGLRQFFPLLSDSSVECIGAGELQLTELAGMVIAEAFLLKLCFDLNECSSRKEVKSEMRSWIACSITALRNPFFHGTLLMMLLEPSLPTASLLSSEDEMLLRELLYDAMILVDYSFLSPKQIAQLPSMCVRSISMARLMVTSEAIRTYRKNGNHKKVVSYSRAFSGSTLPSQIIKMVREEGIASEPNGSSPAALLKWILNIENSGARLFDANISKVCAKLAIHEEDGANEDAKQTVEPDAEEDLFYIDTKGEEDNGSGGHDGDEDDEEMKESMSAAFLAAAQSMHSSEHKRKRRGSDAKKGKIIKKPNVCDESKTVLQKDGAESDAEGSSSSSSSSSDDE